VIDQLDNPTDETIRECATVLCLRGYWAAHSMNACRIALGDCHREPGRDWFRPFVHAMCVWYESEYRKGLGMPSAIAGDEFQVTAMAYLLIANIVLEGAPNPFEEWQSRLRGLFERTLLRCE
jgi:hypothetical protein